MKRITIEPISKIPYKELVIPASEPESRFRKPLSGSRIKSAMTTGFLRWILITSLLSCLVIQSYAQTKADTVVINVGDSSKITFEIRNQKDLQTLKQYDLQAIVNDMLSKLEQRDTSTLNKSSEDYQKPESSTTEVQSTEEKENTNYKKHRTRYIYSRRTYNSINFDLGTNNYLSDGKFPDESNNLYSIKPLGSWYLGINAMQRTRLANVFFLEWGGGVSWYNFKFQNTKTQIIKDDNGITFQTDPRDLNFKKSKLNACYLNLSIVPVIDFGSNRRKPMFFDGDSSESVRFGVGPYIGYLVNSYTKQVYKEDGDKRKNNTRDGFYLDNIRYGLRFQFGFNNVDLFFNYDMNELFVQDKGPKLNAFSFGITL
jgi:hypothetical protein